MDGEEVGERGRRIRKTDELRLSSLIMDALS